MRRSRNQAIGDQSGQGQSGQSGGNRGQGAIGQSGSGNRGQRQSGSKTSLRISFVRTKRTLLTKSSMPRVLRLIAPGFPHHITQRGNYRQKVFHCDEDRSFYLKLLAEFLPHYGVALEAYCLMSNHVHLVATPHDQKGLSRALQRIHSDYARSLHLRLRETGHLWQARFHSVAMDEEHFWAAMVYAEQNPVRARLVEHARQWRWSSAQAHLGLTPSGPLNLVRWRNNFDARRWDDWLSSGPRDSALQERIRQGTLSGFPLGSQSFRDDLRQRLGIKTEPGKPGRPKKPCTAITSPLIARGLLGSHA